MRKYEKNKPHTSHEIIPAEIYFQTQCIFQHTGDIFNAQKYSCGFHDAQIFQYKRIRNLPASYPVDRIYVHDDKASLPPDVFTMALKKEKREEFNEIPDYDKLELFRFIQERNIRAWTVMLIWLSVNAVFAVLYLFGIIKSADLLMLSVFYFLCDYICIIFYCPFQDFIMKNKCCVNCRIYDWGHFMMFTPMLFIKNFFSWSLFFTSLVVLIKWEIVYAKHPERFWSGSNLKLQCSSCKDRTCQIKKNIRISVQKLKK